MCLLCGILEHALQYVVTALTIELHSGICSVFGCCGLFGVGGDWSAFLGGVVAATGVVGVVGVV